MEVKARQKTFLALYIILVLVFYDFLLDAHLDAAALATAPGGMAPDPGDISPSHLSS